MRLRAYHGVILLLGLVVLGIAGLTVWDALNYHRIGFAGTNIPGHMAASYQYLDDTVDSGLTVAADEMIVLEYELQTEEGQLLLEIQAPDGTTLMRMEGNEAGRAEVEVPQAGTYRLVVQGDETRGAYDIHWEVVPRQIEDAMGATADLIAGR